MTKSRKMAFATVAAMAVALSLAIVPALTSQVFAQDCPGCHGRGHETETVCTNPSGKVKGTECPGQSEKSESQDETTTTFAGKSGNPKGSRTV